MVTIAAGNRRTLALGALGVLVLAGAGAAWYVLNQDPPAALAPRVAAEAPVPKAADAAVAAVIARSGLEGFARPMKVAMTVVEAPQAEAQPAAKEPEPKKVIQIEKAKPAPKPARRGYRRPQNLPVLYENYNDLVSAVWMGDFSSARALLDDGKDPNARDADGNTALMIAATRGDTDLARMLLVRGANPNLGKDGGPTPLEIAENADDVEMAALLRSHGANR